MSSIVWIGLLALATPFFLLLGYVMYRVRAKYIHIEIHSDESYSYEVEEYGCVSLLATVLGVIFCTIAIASFVGLLYQIVMNVIVSSLYTLVSVVAVINGILLVLSLGLLAMVAVVSFFKDLFNPPR